MQATISNLLIPSIVPSVTIAHGDESVSFSASCFGRKAFQTFDMFEHINMYWKQLPEAAQLQIFNAYKDINDIFQTVWNRNELLTALAKKTTALLDFHDFETMYSWVLFKSKVIIPDKFETEYIHSVDRQGSREQTYIRSDYTKLVTLALILRTVLPVWGEFISMTRQETGNTFKEYYALQLIAKSSIYHCEPFEKLRVYIDLVVGDDRSSPYAIVEGISSEDFPTWMLSMVSIRRLCVGDIRGIDPKANMITFIHKFITNHVNGGDIAAENTVNAKDVSEGGGIDERKLSSLERYKVKHNISIGEIAELEFLMKDPPKLAHQLSANMTKQLIQSALKSSRVLVEYPVLDPQLTLLRWIIKPVVAPRGVMYFNKTTVAQALAIAQATLWARGFEYLALLSTSYHNHNSPNMYVSGGEPKAKLSKETIADLDALYPYQRVVGGKKTGLKPVNPAVTAIEAMTQNLMQYSWHTSADEVYTKQVLGNTNTNRISVPPDIRLQLAKLVIELANRSWI